MQSFVQGWLGQDTLAMHAALDAQLHNNLLNKQVETPGQEQLGERVALSRLAQR
jgi:hypothetical protein